MSTRHLHDMPVDSYLADSVSVDELNLDTELARVSADLAYWSAQYAAAVNVHLNAKIDAKKAWGAAFLRLREDAITDGERATEKILEAKVVTDGGYLVSAYAESAAEAERARLRGVVDSVSAKKDALQSLCAKLRIEMEGDAYVRRRERQLRDQDNDGLG